MKGILRFLIGGVACVSLVAVAIAQDSGTAGFRSNSAYTLTDLDTLPQSVAAGVWQIYLGKATIDTTDVVNIGPWRRAVLLYRIDASSAGGDIPADSTADDSVDTRVYVDLSWDGDSWTVEDSVDITDTLWHSKQIDSTLGLAGGINGAFIRLRPDPTTGMRQDTIGTRPYLQAKVVYKDAVR